MTINVEARTMDIASVIAGIAMLVRDGSSTMEYIYFHRRNAFTSRAYPLLIHHSFLA